MPYALISIIVLVVGYFVYHLVSKEKSQLKSTIVRDFLILTTLAQAGDLFACIYERESAWMACGAGKLFWLVVCISALVVYLKEKNGNSRQ